VADLLRIYTSFAAFDRDERMRLGLEPLAETLPEPSCAGLTTTDSGEPKGMQSAIAPAKISPTAPTKISPTALRAEGVLEIGRVSGTGILFVRTHVKLYLMHTAWLPDRRLDDYAIALAVNWIENHGLPDYEVAGNLGVDGKTLREALRAAGYERVAAVSKTDAPLKRGNRHGRFMRRPAVHADL